MSVICELFKPYAFSDSDIIDILYSTVQHFYS